MPTNLSRFRTYTTYSLGCAIVWAVLLTVVFVTGNPKRDTVLAVFGGWVIGWLSATIARSVYPPPRHQRPAQPAA